MNYAIALKKLCSVGGKSMSLVVREALGRYLGSAEPSKQEGGGMMFPKAKWRKGAK